MRRQHTACGEQLQRLAALLSLAVAHCGSWGIDAEEPSRVRELDHDSLRHITMQRTRQWIKYDFPNCKDCESMKPIWETAARSVPMPIAVWRVDCALYYSACVERGVLVMDTKGRPVFPQFAQPAFEVRPTRQWTRPGCPVY